MEARIAKIESDVAKIQVDVCELHTEVKAANESIADLRVAVATVDGKIDASSERLDGKIGALSKEVDTRFNALNAKVDANHISTRVSMSELGGNMSDLRESIASLTFSFGIDVGESLEKRRHCEAVVHTSPSTVGRVHVRTIAFAGQAFLHVYSRNA
ncbi:MAG: hypothetical protein WDO68_31245 [Gammaproteobacteria bacterium]